MPTTTSTRPKVLRTKWAEKSTKEPRPSEQDRGIAQSFRQRFTTAMGGLETNSKGQVIDVSSDKPIPGLYAAGESTGGVHGAVRLGSCAVLDCLANGRIAGRKAAQEQNWS